MTVWSENRTKILGAVVSAVGYISAGLAAGMFMGLLQPTAIQWVGIACGLALAILGHWTSAVGFSNTTKERVAAANAEEVVALKDIAQAEAKTAAVVMEAVKTPSPQVSPTVPPGVTRP